VNANLLILGLILAGLQFCLPYRWAFLPLLIAACHTPFVPFVGSFTVVRIVIIVGVLRAWSGGYFKIDIAHPIDRIVGLFIMIVMLSGFAYPWNGGDAFITRLRISMDVAGTYLFARAYLAERESLERFAIGLAAVLIPFGLMMLYERITSHNPYRLLGDQSLVTMVRDGKIRAQGSFGTPILAGTVAATALPFLVSIWRDNKNLALSAMIAALVIIFSTSSSGPIGTMMVAVAVMCVWKWRSRVGVGLVWLVVALIVLHFIKNRPVWYLMALMDFVGGSTGWHRAYLIDMALQHLDEWWAFGTDFTRHWMPYGLANDPNNCDITNYYIQLGITGGLGLTGALLAIQWRSFRLLGHEIMRSPYTGKSENREKFRLWCLASALVAHAVTFLSISYFDQMHVFYWVLIGGMSGFIGLEEKNFDRRMAAMPIMT
jgi:hypothetical protein